MKIAIWTEPLPEGWRWRAGRPVRGTDKFYVETAKWLEEFGHDVEVIYDGPNDSIDGVFYCDRRQSMPSRADRLLVCNDPKFAAGALKRLEPGQITYWTSFADHHTSQVPSDVKRVLISNYAKERSGDRDAHVVPLGIDKSFWCKDPSAKRRDVVLYTSSPDRGWNQCVSAFESISARTGFEFRRSPYGGDAEQTWPQERLRNELQRAKYWIHPGLGVELFCLAAAEAQACGAVPVVVPNQALHETVKCGFRFHPDDYLRGLDMVLSVGLTTEVDANHILTSQAATAKLEAVLLS